MEENKEMLQLLKKINRANTVKLILGVLLCVFMLVMALCCVGVYNAVMDIVPEVNGVVEQAQTVFENLETTTEQLGALDLEGMVEDVDTLVVSAQDSLETTMEKLEAIDIDTLNQAIEDLASVIDPIASFFGKIGQR